MEELLGEALHFPVDGEQQAIDGMRIQKTRCVPEVPAQRRRPFDFERRRRRPVRPACERVFVRESSDRVTRSDLLFQAGMDSRARAQGESSGDALRRKRLDQALTDNLTTSNPQVAVRECALRRAAGSCVRSPHDVFVHTQRQPASLQVTPLFSN